MTNIKFDYSEKSAYRRLMNAALEISINVKHATYIDTINIYLKQTQHEELSEVWIIDRKETRGHDKIYLTYYYVRNDSYKKLEHMTTIERIMKQHYHLVDFEEFEGRKVRLEMVSN